MFGSTRHLTIEWGDCDPAGIVFYPRYFAMFDWSTASLFAAALGYAKPEMLRRFDMVGIPMVDTRGKFHAPTRFGDAVRIESRFAAARRSSLDVEHRLFRGDTLCVEGVETRVWVGRHPDEPGKIKAQPIPREVLDAIGAPPST